MYRVTQYGWMISDKERTGAYAAALEQCVKPGSVVVDIGTGTGIFALLACRYGARKVFAIDPHMAADLGREIAEENGLADRIEFIKESAKNVTLPSRADVIVSDIRGVLPIVGDSLPALIDARKRFLRPGGVMIPRTDRLFVAAVESAESYRWHSGPWDERPFGFSMSAARRAAMNEWEKANNGPLRLLSEPRRWAELEYLEMESPDAAGRVSLSVHSAGTMHGLLVWFDSELGPGIAFSNAPDRDKLVYGQAFFPIDQPAAVDAGDEVGCSIQARFIDTYVWTWETTIRQPGGRVKHSSCQSTFFGLVTSAAVRE
jgi:protein arginine N-methyltransferase 1